MNSIGWAIIFKMGCLCTKETIIINDTKYVIKEHIGQGGFSIIDLAENVVTKQRYAIKRITCHSVDDQKVALREIEFTDKVRNENVIRIVDFAIDGTADIVVNQTSQAMMVLPYYRNGSLHEHLVQRAKIQKFFSEQQVLELFLGICEGVKAFHEVRPAPLAHRDLKTANICLTESMSPIIVDLGSTTEARVQVQGQQDARRLQELAEERCSIVYRAPELFSVESYCMIDERTDIWSLGCVLYAICFFKNPFEGAYEKGDSVALAVLSGNLTFPDHSPYTPDMHELILFMLRINPMERPYIYSVIEKANDLVSKMESRV